MKQMTPYNRNRFRDFDSLFDQFLAPANYEPLDFNPKLDVEEFDDHYLASFDLPGMKLEDIKIDLHDSQLKVSGERAQENKKEDNGWSHTERSFGSFQRMITLPKNIESESLEANYNNGVLDVLIPKSVKSSARKIEVKSEPEGFLKRLMS